MSIVKKHIAIMDEKGEIVKFLDISSWKQNKLLLKGNKIEVTIKKFTKSRSGNQNRYLHAVIFKMFAESMGCTIEEAKDALKQKFLSTTLRGGLKSTKPTHTLTTVEIEDFMRHCRQLGAEMFDMYVPLPNEASY